MKKYQTENDPRILKAWQCNLLGRKGTSAEDGRQKPFLQSFYKKGGSPEEAVMNPVQSPEYQDTESHSSLLVQDCQKGIAIRQYCHISLTKILPIPYL